MKVLFGLVLVGLVGFGWFVCEVKVWFGCVGCFLFVK